MRKSVMLILIALGLLMFAAPANANWGSESPMVVTPAWSTGSANLHLSPTCLSWVPNVQNIVAMVHTSEGWEFGWAPLDTHAVSDYESVASGDFPLSFSGPDGAKLVMVSFAVWDGEQDPGMQHLPHYKDPSGIYVASTTLDTHGPVTKAPYPASCKRGGYAALRYKVIDNLSPSADVTIRIHKVLSGGSRLVKTLRLGKHRTGKMQTYIYRCTLPQGKYRFTVGAADLAGNETIKPAANTLTVR